LHTKGLATWSTVKEASELLRSGEIEPLAVVERCLERQKEVVGLNAFVTPGSEVAGVTSKLKGRCLMLWPGACAPNQ
jgi:Asp-tRNA(Asn)/Glu-tRNA(Gln) amidotransferase A subunit family amidase